jgi:hypothetical protein
MATVSGMAWEAARRAFLRGYDDYQIRGGQCQSPWQQPGDKRCGLWTAGKDAARRRVPRSDAWDAFREREMAVI